MLRTAVLDIDSVSDGIVKDRSKSFLISLLGAGIWPELLSDKIRSINTILVSSRTLV